MITPYIKNYLKELNAAHQAIDNEDMEKLIAMLFAAYQGWQQIFIMGNGGSAAVASHFACDLGKGTLQRVYDQNEKRIKVISLTDNVPVLTAFANDLSYDEVFSQQLHNLVNPKDVVIAITGSGNSKNIIKAVELAKQMGAVTVGLLGFDGGKLKGMVDYKIIIPSSDYGVIEDSHSTLSHIISGAIAKLKNQ